MTLKEIARQANVSVSTVSRVINQKNTKAASPEVQERIWKIVRKSGYTPNATARSLKLGQKAQIQNTTPKSIACIYARSNSAVSDPFFSQIAKAIEQEAVQEQLFYPSVIYSHGYCKSRYGTTACSISCRRNRNSGTI